MRVKAFKMPPGGAAVDQSGRLTSPMQGYLAGLETVSKRVAAEIEPLPASPTNAQIATAFNALLAALQAGELMHDED